MSAVAQSVPAPLSRRRKAAIIVRLLLAEGAALPLDHLPDDIQSALTEEIGALRYIDRETLRNVVAEFLRELEKIGLTFPDGIDGALALLDGHISKHAAAALRGQPKELPDPWTRIAALEVERLLPMVQAESAEVGAVVLSKLETAKAAALLGQMPGAAARRIASAMSLTGNVAPQTVARIGAALAAQLDAIPVRAFDDPPAERIGAILNLAPATRRQEVLEDLEATDTGFAATVKKAIFVFEDIPTRVRPADVATFARAVTADSLTTALAADPEGPVAGFILSNLARRVADQLREDMTDRGTVPPRAAEAAAGDVVAAIRGLMDAGQITLIDPGAEDEGA